MGKLFALWEGLGPRQKIAAGAIGSAGLAWAIGRILDAISVSLPTLVPLAMIGHGLTALVGDPYLEGGVVAAGAIGFGPNLWNIAKDLTPLGWFNLAIALGMVCAFIGAVIFGSITIYQAIFYVPRLYAPHENRSGRIFTTLSPGKIEQLFNSYTDLQANNLLRPEVGKWIAVTGVVDEVSIPEFPQDAVEVRIGSYNFTYAKLDFDKKWTAKLADFNKGARIYVICQFADADKASLTLNSCELGPP